MAADPRPRTVGVEEELLLFEHGTTHLARLGDALADQQAGHPGVERTVQHEFKRAQIEAATSPHRSMAALRADIEAARRDIARRARPRGAVVGALATDPAPSIPLTTRDERYARMVELYGAVADGQLACGMHVHVSVESADEGVQVIDRIRARLPVLLAMSANSPYYQGRDTGYASFRGVMWGLWPTSGPTDVFGSVDAYRSAVDALITSGAAMDEAMIYFDARLAVRYPTVEIRIMDVTPTPEDAVLLAALCRGLVDRAAEDGRHGIRPIDVSSAQLRAATWRAARFGLTGELVDPSGSALMPAEQAVAELVEHVRPALVRSGDETLVEEGVRRLLARGTGADRQRRAFSRTASTADVIDAAIRWTDGPSEA
jgi:carboxylate-amine ligase